MPSFRERQTSFAGGEFAPGLHGRTDFQRYRIGCRTARNYFVGPEGQLMSRPGTSVVAALEYSDTWCRLVPFHLDGGEGLVVVAPSTSHGRVIQNGSVLAATFPSPHPFKQASKYSQIGDVMSVVVRGSLPAELRRTASDSLTWESALIDFGLPQYVAGLGIPYLDVDTVADADADHPALPWRWRVTKVCKDANGRYYETAFREINQHLSMTFLNLTDWDAARYRGGTYPIGWPVRCRADHNHWYVCTAAVPRHGNGLMPTDDTSHWSQQAWDYATMESAWLSDEDDEYVVYPDKPVTIRAPQLPFSSLYNDDIDEVVAMRVYRGRDGVFGLVGQASIDTEMFVDDGQTPDWATPPPSDSTLPRYDVYLFQGNGNYGTGSNATFAAVAYAQGRRLLAGSADFQGTLFGSALSQFARFDNVRPPKDSDAYALELASGRHENIEAIVPASDLLLFTDTGIWLVEGADGGPITPNSMMARQLAMVGCGSVAPLVVGDTVWWLRRKGNVPMAMIVGRESGGNSYAPEDVSSLWRHLFDGHTIVDWCYAEDPFHIIWAVRDDGVLLSCTFSRSQEMVAWTRHEIAGGLVEAVATVPEGTEDAVYLAVRRGGTAVGSGGHVYIERLATRLVEEDSVEDYVGVDGSVTVDGRNTSAKTYASTGGGEGEAVTVTVTGEAVDGEDDGRVIRIYDADGVECIEVLLEYSGLAGQYNGTVTREHAYSVSATTNWGYVSSSVSGLPTETTEAYALIDGKVYGPLTVASGTVTLPTGVTGVIVTAGSRYRCDFESLGVAEERGREKIVKALLLEIEGSRGAFVGQSIDADDEWIDDGSPIGQRPMQEVSTRKVSDAYAVSGLVTDSFRIVIGGEWGQHGRAAVRHESPLPLTILGLMREVESGG